MFANGLLLFYQHFISSSQSKSALVRKLNTKQPVEKSVMSLFNTLASRAKVANVKLNAHSSQNDSQATGWPFANTVTISEDLLANRKKGFPKQSLAAIFAHELTHLNNQDSLTRLVSWFFLTTLELQYHLFLACGTILLGFAIIYGIHALTVTSTISLLSDFFTLIFPLIGTLLGLKGILHLFSLLNEILSHALEFMADEGAVLLTNDPLSVALMTFEIQFYGLRMGKIHFEIANRDSVHIDSQLHQGRAKQLFKEIHDIAKAEHLPTGEIYRQTIQHAFKNHVLPTVGSLIHRPRSHPFDAMRRKVIKTAHPHIFKGILKIL